MTKVTIVTKVTEGSKWGWFLWGADPDVQGLLQAHGHHQKGKGHVWWC